MSDKVQFGYPFYNIIEKKPKSRIIESEAPITIPDVWDLGSYVADQLQNAKVDPAYFDDNGRVVFREKFSLQNNFEYTRSRINDYFEQFAKLTQKSKEELKMIFVNVLAVNDSRVSNALDIFIPEPKPVRSLLGNIDNPKMLVNVVLNDRTLDDAIRIAIMASVNMQSYMEFAKVNGGDVYEKLRNHLFKQLFGVETMARQSVVKM